MFQTFVTPEKDQFAHFCTIPHSLFCMKLPIKKFCKNSMRCLVGKKLRIYQIFCRIINAMFVILLEILKSSFSDVTKVPNRQLLHCKAKGEFTQYPFFIRFRPFFLRFCFLKKYALFHPHFYKSIYALTRLLYIDKNFVQKFCV